MSTPKMPTQNKIILAVLVFGLVAFVLYMAFFVNVSQVVETLASTNPAIYAGAFIGYMLYTLCSSLVWRSLLNNVSVSITKRKALLFTWVGLFFDATIPQLGWSAEISKTYLLAKDSDIDAAKIGASVVGQKLFTMSVTIIALSIGLGLVLFRYSLDFVVAVFLSLVLALSIVTLAVVYYVSIKPSATKTLLNWAIRVALAIRRSWNPQNFRSRTEGILGKFHASIEQLKTNPKALVQPIFLSVMGFVFEVSVVFLSFAALKQPLPVDAVLVVFTITGMLQTIGIAFFGFPEIVMSATLTGLGIDQSIAVSVAILTRIVNLWFRLGVSYVALQWAGIKIIRRKDVP